jgi:hypothetical protein
MAFLFNLGLWFFQGRLEEQQWIHGFQSSMPKLWQEAGGGRAARYLPGLPE